jgi:hypothetical protein
VLTPAHTLGDFLPPKSAVSPRAPADGLAWLPRDPVWRERATGAPLAVTGDAPLLCHEGVARPAALDLMAKAGLALPARLLTYAREEEFAEQLHGLAAEGRRVYVSHPEPRPALAGEHYVCPMPLLGRLQDKGNLAELVPAAGLPERRVVAPAELRGLLAAGAIETPIVLKAAAPLGSGGGLDVRVCLAPGELEVAVGELCAAERVVLERFYRFGRSFCLNYGIGGAGITYLGAAEQICDARGAYAGNWLDAQVGPGADLVELGLETARAGRALGYRGILGVDAGRAESGRPVLFDPNFRLNACTAQVLLARSVAADWGRACTRLRSGLVFRGGFSEMVAALQRQVAARSLVPLVVFDGNALRHPPPHPSCSLLLTGDDRADVERRLAALRREGFSA